MIMFFIWFQQFYLTAAYQAKPNITCRLANRTIFFLNKFQMQWNKAINVYKVVLTSNYNTFTFSGYSIICVPNFLKQTWKCGLETHLAICLKSGSMIFWNCEGSMTSRISSISPRNITYNSGNTSLVRGVQVSVGTSSQNPLLSLTQGGTPHFRTGSFRMALRSC